MAAARRKPPRLLTVVEIDEKQKRAKMANGVHRRRFDAYSRV
jgi:hypothetical protein